MKVTIQTLCLQVLLLMCLVGCDSPDSELWPPKKNETKIIYVTSDGFHTALVFPELQKSRYVSWAYAEEAWYLENSTGCWGGGRALFLPSRAVLEKRLLKSKPVTHEKLKVWKFHVSDAGFFKMKNYVHQLKETERSFKATNKSVSYYYTNDSYHIFNTCHGFTADVLKKGGLPLSNWWMIEDEDIVEELNKIQKWHLKKNLK